MAARINPWWLIPISVVAVAAIGGGLRARIPQADDWRAAVAAIRAELKPGDGVTWAPYALGEGRIHFGDLPVFHADPLSETDLSRYDRVFVMGAAGHDADELPPEHTLEARARYGALTVDRVRVGGERVVGDLYATLESATVSRSGASGDPRVCDFFSGSGWHCDLRDDAETTRRCLALPIAQRWQQRQKNPDCGLAASLHVSRDVRLIGDAPRRCIYFHPVAAAAVRLSWSAAPAGERLVVSGGFSDPMVADNYRKAIRVEPLKLVVSRGGAVLRELDVPAEKGWFRHEIELPEGTAPIDFVLTGPSPTDADFCFDPVIQTSRAEGQAP